MGGGGPTAAAIDRGLTTRGPPRFMRATEPLKLLGSLGPSHSASTRAFASMSYRDQHSLLGEMVMVEGGGHQAVSIGVPELSSPPRKSWSGTRTSSSRFPAGASPTLRSRAATPLLMSLCFVSSRTDFQ